jgi:hypothetical protein
MDSLRYYGGTRRSSAPEEHCSLVAREPDIAGDACDDPMAAEGDSVCLQSGTLRRMTHFELDVYDEVLRSLEVPLDGHPVGPWTYPSAIAWLVRTN